MPSSRRSNFIASLRSRRITMLSPFMIGIVLMRMSISRRPIWKFVRPSCGRRLSAMFSAPISLMRDAIAG